MKFTPLRWAALVFVVAGFSRSPAVAEQHSDATGDTLRIGATVDPTCSVKVNPGESAPDAAVKLACRNLRDGQPEPMMIETAPRDGREVVLIQF